MARPSGYDPEVPSSEHISSAPRVSLIGTTSPLSAAAPYGELAFVLSLLGTLSQSRLPGPRRALAEALLANHLAPICY